MSKFNINKEKTTTNGNLTEFNITHLTLRSITVNTVYKYVGYKIQY